MRISILSTCLLSQCTSSQQYVTYKKTSNCQCTACQAHKDMPVVDNYALASVIMWRNVHDGHKHTHMENTVLIYLHVCHCVSQEQQKNWPSTMCALMLVDHKNIYTWHVKKSNGVWFSPNLKCDNVVIENLYRMQWIYIIYMQMLNCAIEL